ncbi:regulator of hemoglobinization and erythroid cell expansion protein [Tenrec ecaudatus]|uniref:regulator of hemoglobinization and erythroid cell expansion protein n=1 Tax=Tenrec ecaudatus TaxID=94439 RepID=UPI003F5AB605
MKVWHGLVIAAVSVFLQTCLLTALNYLLSRRRANESEPKVVTAKPPSPGPSPAHHCLSVAKENPGNAEGTQRRSPVSDLHCRHDSDTSSDDSSDSSDSSPSSHQAPRNVNYTQVIFPSSGGLKSESALDYENVKEATDYVNVNPQGHKGNIWTFVNHAASESVEYTQVAV